MRIWNWNKFQFRSSLPFSLLGLNIYKFTVTWTWTFDLFLFKSGILSNFGTLWTRESGIVVISSITKRCVYWIMARSKLLIIFPYLHFHLFGVDLSICLSLSKIFFRKRTHRLFYAAHWLIYKRQALGIYELLGDCRLRIYFSFCRSYIPFFWLNSKRISLIYYKPHQREHFQC